MASPPPASPPNIYIVGAQSTGKTTLVNNLRLHFTTAHHKDGEEATPETPLSPPTIITEVARTVLKQHSFTAEDVTKPSRSSLLQQLILQAQAAAEEEAIKVALDHDQRDVEADGTTAMAAPWFISDRSGADPIVYAQTYAGHDAFCTLVESDEWTVLRQRMRDSVVVVCEAAEANAGWLADDGVRLMPSDVDDWVSFHDRFCEFLKEQGVPYAELPAELTGYTDRVAFVVERWSERWTKRLT